VPITALQMFKEYDASRSRVTATRFERSFLRANGDKGPTLNPLPPSCDPVLFIARGPRKDWEDAPASDPRVGICSTVLF
jgi:hypothetical protein